MSDENQTKDQPTSKTLSLSDLRAVVDALVVYCEKYQDAPVLAVRNLRESLENLGK